MQFFIVSINSILLLFNLICLTAHADQLYHWVDKSGHITFTDSPIPPSPDHQLADTKHYTPTSPEIQEQGRQRLEEIRNYNLEHPLPLETSKQPSNEISFSKAECESAMRHYKLEAESLARTRDSVDAAEAQMRAKCSRPERQSHSIKLNRRNRFIEDNR